MDDAALRRVRGSEIAMVFQDPMSSLNPSLTVGRQLVEPLRQHLGMDRRSARQRAAELLDLVGVPNAPQRLRDYPHQFSGGMAQRVMIAMALAGEPSVVIADEPTTALDVTRQRQVLDLLLTTCRELGVAVLFITHDLGVVAEVCDRVIVMYASQAVEVAEVEPLFARPLHPYTKALLGSIPRLDHDQDRLTSLSGRVPSIFEEFRGCRFEPRCSAAQDQCRSAPPRLVNMGGEHLVRCPVVTDNVGVVTP
jgi:oligopeptide/dipeptide ABC transporter ATP-binding protein